MLPPLAGGRGTVVKFGEFIMILELHWQGLKVAAIARQLGIDRKTVRKYISRGLEPSTYGPRPHRQKSTDPFLLYLRERLVAFPGLTAVWLWREMRERGYAGGYTAVKRAVRDIRPEPITPFEVRVETPPGEQAQVDLARFEVEFTDEPGVTRIVWLFCMVLGYSRLIWARFIIHHDLQSVLRCHIAALDAPCAMRSKHFEILAHFHRLSELPFHCAIRSTPSRIRAAGEANSLQPVPTFLLG
jgi:transposase